MMEFVPSIKVTNTAALVAASVTVKDRDHLGDACAADGILFRRTSVLKGRGDLEKFQAKCQ